MKNSLAELINERTSKVPTLLAMASLSRAPRAALTAYQQHGGNTDTLTDGQNVEAQLRARQHAVNSLAIRK